MPVMNAAPFIAEAIESVLAQTERAFEFIIIDDGSTDDTAAIIDDFARRDDRIRFIQAPDNRGLAARLNQAIGMAKTPMIARMDGDDICAPDRLEKQLAYMDAHGDVVMVGSRVLAVDPDGDPLVELGAALTHEEIDNGLMARAGQLVFHSTIVFPKSVALAIGGYDESYVAAQDVDFFLKLAEVGRVVNIAEPLLKYRVHFSSAGFARVREQEEAVDRALEAARRRRGLPALSETERDEAERRRRKPSSRAERERIWGWWALKGGNPRIARKHALRTLSREPVRSESWRLLWCALRGA